MKVDDVTNTMRWDTLVGLSHRLPVRAQAQVWRGLTAEENLFTTLQIFGRLEKSGTLDISEVTIGGQTLSERNTARLHQQMLVASLKAQNAVMRADTAALRAETTAEQTERTLRRVEAELKE